MLIERKSQDKEIVIKYAEFEPNTIENCRNNDTINKKDLVCSLQREKKYIVSTPTLTFCKRQQKSYVID